MNKTFRLLNFIFALLGALSGMAFLFLDIDSIRYIQIFTVAFFLSDALMEFSSEDRNKRLLIFKSVLAILISITVGIILFKGY